MRPQLRSPRPRRAPGSAGVLALGLAGLAAGAFAAVGQADLQLQGTGPYYTFTVPLALRSAAASPDLDDLQLLNARGEALPFAWLAALPPSTEAHRTDATLFKMPGAASGGKPAAAQGWIFDVRKAKGTLVRLELTLPPQVQGLYTLSVEAGDDLQHWRPLRDAVQVLSLQHQGQRLASTTIDLGQASASYLRLKPVDGSPLPELAGAQVDSLSEQSAGHPLQWTPPIAPVHCEQRHCDYALPPHVPVEQLELQLAEPNNVGLVHVLGRVDPQVEPGPRRPHGVRGHLRALRHKSQPSTPAPGPTWQPLGSAQAYWLRLPQGEARSGILWLDGGQYPQLRVQTDGPMTQLGATPPVLRVGARAPSLVLLARGPAPYRVTWGSLPEKPADMPLSQLMPTRHERDPLPGDSAHVDMPAVPAAAAATPVAAASATPASPAVSSAAPPKPQRAWLWAVLLVGVGSMGAMAWSLLRRPRTD